MKEKYPEFVEKLEKHGLLYTRVLGEEDDPSSPIGRGWKSTFLTTDKFVIEEMSVFYYCDFQKDVNFISSNRAAKLNMKLEWTKNGGVKTIMGPNPAIKYDETRGRKIWFNSVVAAYTDWKDARNNPENAVTFEDGSPLPVGIIYDCVNILDEESIVVMWRKEDVLLIDNMTVLHARKPFDPPRRISASLCK